MPVEVLVPPLGQTVDTLSFVSWLKQEGELVQQGEPLYVVETDKAMLDVEAPATGILAHVTAQKGDEVKVLSPIAIILAAGESAEQVPPGGTRHPETQGNTSTGSGEHRDTTVQRSGDNARMRRFVSPRARQLADAEGVPLNQLQPTGPEGAVIERDVRAYLVERATALAQAQGVAASAAAAHDAPEVTAGAGSAESLRTASPLARKLAEQAGVDLSAVAGSGPRGQITREDVEAAASARPVAPLPAGRAPVEVIPLAGIRGVTSQRMSASSRETAPVTLTTEADATELVRLRERLVADGIPVAYNDLLLYALAKSLRGHPRLNASLDGESIKLWPQIDIGLAVDTERGLLVPVMRDVDRKGLSQLAAESKALAERARAGRCTVEELTGSTFTLTNLGMYGIDAFTPIINLPECAILGVGRIKTQPVWVGDHVEGRELVWLSLTFDHRLVDGAPAARFLQAVVRSVEKPHLLMA